MAMFVSSQQLPEIMNKHEGLLGAIYGVPLPRQQSALTSTVSLYI
jgi:hypothetical protein